MIIKQVQFKGVDSAGNVFCQPLLFKDGGLEKTASALEMRSKLHPRVQDFVRNLIPTSAGIYILVNALGAGEYWGSNVNGDFFPEKALIHAPSDWEQLSFEEMRRVGKSWEYGFPTFMNAYPYKHHMNKDPSRAFGRVELAVWNPKMHRVELVIYLDRALCMQFDAMDVIERIERGEFPDVSMGCKVPYDVCMICGKKSKSPQDYCVCAATMMNKILPDGRKVAVRNDFPRFFDLSIVFIGADKTAKVMAKFAHVGNRICLGDFCSVQRSSAEVAATFSPFMGIGDLISDLSLEKVASMKQDAETPIEKTAEKVVIRDFIAGGLSSSLLKQANDPIKKKIEVQGVPIWIEWKKGETRLYKKKGKVAYERFMKADYGYIPDTLDADGEEIDVYVGPERSSPKAFVIKQLKADGSFDENKVMVGFRTEKAAKACYDYHMGGAKERFGGIHEVPVSALTALFGENGGKEKKASACSCSCDGEGLCDLPIEKIAALVFPVDEKTASHAKLSELIKSIPAGPFSKETLPRLEKSERDIPSDVLDLMGGLPGETGLSTPAMCGMVLKPREFQRIVLVHIGRKPLADEMDRKGMTFQRSNDAGDDFSIGDDVEPKLVELLSALGLTQDRSVAGPSLSRRSLSAPAGKVDERPYGGETSNSPLMKKLARAYNGYRQWILMKTAQISNFMTSDPQLRADVFGDSMAQVFAGGIDKVATSVLSPDSLAYLVGAYQNRDNVSMADEVVASLALTGAMAVPV